MKKALGKLAEKQIEFICKECSLTEEELFNMSEDDLYDKVYEPICDIEIEEVCSNGGENESERCEMASDIVTLLGNALRLQDRG